MRKIDETGLCARDCECPRCEAGIRPTELERAAAKRALAMRAAALSRPVPASRKAAKLLTIAEGHRRAVGETERMLASYRPPPPLTPEQRAELDELRARIGKGS
jgi:hypothetical protein